MRARNANQETGDHPVEGIDAIAIMVLGREQLPSQYRHMQNCEAACGRHEHLGNVIISGRP